ncbi:MAG: deoxyguanosinetriphosphate triphosphohydrolase [Gammaproteobacteria bacterium]
MTPARDLAIYAAGELDTRGRAIVEPPPKYRSEYQRDRDRIIHSTAFRRLLYKTQVFVNYEGDMYRTRLTHSLEVAQIARTVARALRLNEDLVEAISLAHDLGHTPFGHAGQDALNDCMRDFGGFEHNLQSLRVVDELEQRYASFTGLNLCFETREGLLKHCSLANARRLGDVGRRFIERTQPGLEAQLANIADEIAYNNHDVDDGLRSGLISLRQLAEIPFFADKLRIVRERYGKLDEGLLCHEVVREMIDTLVTDLLNSSQETIAAAAPQSIDDVRQASKPLIRFSDAHTVSQRELKSFLRRHLYAHPRVTRMTEQAHETIKLLFDTYKADFSKLPALHAERARAAARQDEAQAARIVADYIAGMTDRFALGQRERFR